MNKEERLKIYREHPLHANKHYPIYSPSDKVIINNKDRNITTINHDYSHVFGWNR